MPPIAKSDKFRKAQALVKANGYLVGRGTTDAYYGTLSRHGYYWNAKRQEWVLKQDKSS